jgi:hypothetical protein
MWSFFRLEESYHNSKGIYPNALVSNLWYAHPWVYAADRLGVHENNIGNGGKRQKEKELK